MATTFAFAESRNGELRKVAFEAVTAARRAADASGGGEVHALVLAGVGGSVVQAHPERGAGAGALDGDAAVEVALEGEAGGELAAAAGLEAVAG